MATPNSKAQLTCSVRISNSSITVPKTNFFLHHHQKRNSSVMCVWAFIPGFFLCLSTKKKKHSAKQHSLFPSSFPLYRICFFRVTWAIPIPKPLSQSKYQPFWLLLLPPLQKDANFSFPNSSLKPQELWCFLGGEGEHWGSRNSNLAALVVLVLGTWPAPVAQRVLMRRWGGSHQRGW